MKAPEPRPFSSWSMVLLAVAVGGVAGFGAIAFRGLIALFHNLLFLGELSFAYDANLHTAVDVRGAWVILVPVVGAVIVTFLVRTFAPEARGHGVPEVIDAIYYKNAVIRPAVVLVKSLASALSIGSGGSVGREGPIAQIGAAFGSTLGQWVAMPGRQRTQLVAAGAGAGIAATFDTPVGGVLFAVELMLPVTSPFSLTLVTFAVGLATAIGRVFFGSTPAFHVPSLASLAPGPETLVHVPLFLILGCLVGLLAVVFVRGIYWLEDAFDALPGNAYTRHILGMAMMGAVFYGLSQFSEPWFGQPNHFYVEGVGYATIMDVLSGRLTATGFLFLLVAAKLLATCLTLGSGASGGVFSPALVLGAAFGAGFGALAGLALPELASPPARYAIAAMAGMVGGATGAVLTAVVMVFEMTWDYGSILPLLITAATAGAVRQALCRPTIYTLKLLRRGHVVPQGLQAGMDGVRLARDAMVIDFTLLETETGADLRAVRRALAASRPIVVAGTDGRIRGVYDSYLPRLPEDDSPTGLLHHTEYVVVDPKERLVQVLRTMDEAKASVALVLRPGPGAAATRLVGVITDRHLADMVRERARMMD